MDLSRLCRLRRRFGGRCLGEGVAQYLDLDPVTVPVAGKSVALAAIEEATS